MTDSTLPFIELVQRLRGAGVLLTPEQYARFRQALLLGFGGGTDELRRLCRLLWVKPSASYDSENFERVFKQFIDDFTPQLPDVSPQISDADHYLDTKIERSSLSPAQGDLPLLPPRVFPDNGPSDESELSDGSNLKVTTAIATPTSETPADPTRSPYRLSPEDLPVTEADWQYLWSVLRRPTPIRRTQELDVKATIARMERQGAACDPVLRPVLSRRSNLVIWLDTNNAMIPFRPALQSLIHAVTTGRIQPAQIYLFTTFPLRFVYPWESSLMADPIDRVLSRLHRQRTIALIVSDAGAASRLYNYERITKTNQFLEQLAPCVQQVIWLNPLPRDRWGQTSAIDIADFLNGRMYALCRESLSQILADRHRRFLPAARPLIGGAA